MRLFRHRRPLSVLWCGLLFSVFFLNFSVVSPVFGENALHLTPGYLWSGWFGGAHRLPVMADVNGDGFADVCVMDPKGGTVIGLLINVKGEKPLGGTICREQWAGDSWAICRVKWTQTDRDELAVVFKSGEVRVLTDFKEGKFQGEKILGRLTGKLDQPCFITAFRQKGSNAECLLACEPSGNAWILRQGEKEPEISRINLKSAGIVAIGACDLDADGGDELVLQTEKGVFIQSSSDAVKPVRVASSAKNDLFCCGRFGQNGKGGIVAGDRLYEMSLPDAKKKGKPVLLSTQWLPLNELKTRSIVCAGDITGDGRDDLARFFTEAISDWRGEDCLVYFTYEDSEPDWDHDGLTNDEEKTLGGDPLKRSTMGDGILDGWKAKGFRGLDLKALGCDVKHRDILMCISRNDDVDEKTFLAELEKLKAFYQRIPLQNPDGTTGIGLHPVLLPPIKLAEDAGKPWWEMSEKHFPKEYRGIAHWMQVTQGGGGQSNEWGDSGCCGINAMWLAFAHELGHQIGLGHNTGWPLFGCPTYTSIMNYCYSYGFNGSSDQCHFSEGKLKSLVLRETDLDERLPFPLKDVEFLSKGPYHFRLQDKGAETWIDWNWNGIFGERHVKADINYGYSTNGGERQTIDKTVCGPLLVSYKPKSKSDQQECLLFIAKFQEKEAPPKDSKPPHTICPERPGTLLMRRYLGQKKWAEAVEIEHKWVTGDPAGVAFHDRIYLFYPMEKDCAMRVLSFDAHTRTWDVGPRAYLPGTKGMEVSAGVIEDSRKQQRLILFFRDPVSGAVRWTECRESGIGPPIGPIFISTMTPGLCFDSYAKELVVGCGQDFDANKKSRWQLRRFRYDAGMLLGNDVEWVEGPNGFDAGHGRVNLLFQNTPDAGPKGRLYFIASGLRDPNSESSGYWVAMQIADKSVRDGWLTRRYYDEWTNSRSAPAACWFQDDVMLASRWIGGGEDDNNLYIAYHGLGIDTEPMGDFDDVSHIANLGLERSILYFAKEK